MVVQKSLAQLNHIKAQLVSSGVTLLYSEQSETVRSGYHAIYFEDPDRIKLEIVYDQET